MRSTNEIQRLCETWWERLAQSTREDQHSYAERYLSHLGWDESEATSPVAVPGHPATLAYIHKRNGYPNLVAYFTLPGVLEPPTGIVKRSLDFCESTRALVDINRLYGAPYAFITDLFRSYLYDAKTDELLLSADTPTAFTTEFGDLLSRASVDSDALEELRRQPRSFVARQLREWLHRWSETLTLEWRASEESAALAMDRLLVLRFLVEQNIVQSRGGRAHGAYRSLIAGIANGTYENTGKSMIALFRALHEDLALGLFTPQPPLEATLEQDAVAGPMMRELGLLSRTKFSVATVLESFNYGDAAEKLRVRMIPEENEERNIYLATQTLQSIDSARIELDLEDEGYRALIDWFERLIEVYDRLSAEYEHAPVDEVPDQRDMDLFDWSEHNAKRPRALTDRLHHAIESGMVVYCRSPRQFRTARLLLYLHLIARYGKQFARNDTFPSIEPALQRRPQMLESDRRRIFQGTQSEEWDVI